MSQTSPLPTILVVDDNVAARNLIGEYLSRHNFNVLHAANGQLAMECLQSNPVDLVILDILMPVMNGYEVLDAMQADQHLVHTPVVVISAVGEIQSVVQCLELGADDYLYKPINRTLLMARVNNSLEKRRLQQTQLDSLAELNRLNDQFVHSVTHEMKNPLALITGYIELLLEDEALPREEAHSFLVSIQRYAQQMNLLVQDLLDLAKIKMTLSLDEVDIAPLVRSCTADMELLAEQKHISLSVDVPNESLKTRIDEVRVGRVLSNLLSNAIKYTGEGGTVRVAVDTYSDSPEELLIQVIDNGYGIPPADIPHIFDTFYRVRDSQYREIEGTGLGLAIARAIVEQHGGRIWCESEVSVGSTFNFTLPLLVP